MYFFLKNSPIQAFEKEDLPFNGRSSFHHEDKIQLHKFGYLSSILAEFFPNLLLLAIKNKFEATHTGSILGGDLAWACHDEVPQTRWLKQQKFHFSQFWRWGSPRSRCWLVERFLPGLQIASFLLCLHVAEEKTVSLFSSSCKATNPIRRALSS